MTHDTPIEQLTDQQLIEERDRLRSIRESQLRAEGNAWSDERGYRFLTLIALDMVEREIYRRNLPI